jgi:hypothetical protein
MKSIACTISYGKTEIDYELLMMNRKSLEIAVHPDKSVVVKAPSTSGFEAIEEKIKKRARWIKRQIAYFNQFDPRTPDRKYVGGESHLYLGRKYRLKIEASDKDQVLLKNGYFWIETTSNETYHIKFLMDAWYRRRAKMYLCKIFNDCWAGFNKGDLNKPNLKLQKMEKRWGSLSSKGRLTLNVKLIHAPKECIEYVVIHELCHLIHHNHGSKFYKLLEHTLPDWMKRKHKLESC